MIVLSVQEAPAAAKPVLCPQCRRGKIGHVPAATLVKKSKRGKPPPDGEEEIYTLRCAFCGTYISMTIE